MRLYEFEKPLVRDTFEFDQRNWTVEYRVRHNDDTDVIIATTVVPKRGKQIALFVKVQGQYEPTDWYGQYSSPDIRSRRNTIINN